MATVILAFFIGVSQRRASAQMASTEAAEIQSHLQRAHAALKANQPGVAEEELHALLALDPRNSEAYANLGVIAFFRGDCRNASENFRRALAIKPDIADAQALLGICEMKSGSPSAQALLESSFSQLTDKKLRTEIGLELEEIYYRQGDLERASTLAQTLVRLAPDNVDVLYMAQRVYEDLAGDTLNKLALLAPRSARMEQAIAERLVNEGDVDGAISHYRKALEMDPRLAGVHFELGEAILQSSSHGPKTQAEAEAEFETAEKIAGDNAGIECQLGRIDFLRLNLQQSLAHYRRALALNPADSDAALGIGKALLNLQKPEEAVKYLRMAVESDPLSGEAHYQLAIAYRNLHMNEQAQKEMRMFNEINTTMDRVRALYRQMNRPTFPAEHSPGSPPPH